MFFVALSVQTACVPSARTLLPIYILYLLFFFFFFLLLFIVKGALEHIPACIGLKEEEGETAWTGCQSITHAPRKEAEHAKN